jgi:hypothetical protein
LYVSEVECKAHSKKEREEISILFQLGWEESFNILSYLKQQTSGFSFYVDLNPNLQDVHCLSKQFAKHGEKKRKTKM